MRRLCLLIVALTAACGSDSAAIDAPATHDAVVHDAEPDSAGSGSAVATIMEPSPRDHNLELIVAAAGVVVALAPASRRRRTSRPDVL